MAENGIVNNLGLSRRSVTSVGAMSGIMYLAEKDALVAMVLVFLLGVGYMIMDELKDRRKDDKTAA